WRGQRDGARYGPVAAEQDSRGTVFRHIVRGLIEAYGRTEFELRRQRDPQLEAARPAGFVEPAPVPHATPRLHPFGAAGRQRAPDVVRIDIADRAFRDVGQSRDTRMRMERAVERRPLMVEEVE